jgi:hypothetical protein
VQIVVVLKERAAPGPAQSTTQAAGARLVPQHPGVDDELLSRFFVAELPDPGEAERLAEALRGLDEVDGAYVKPAEEPARAPGGGAPPR